ncbi:MAG: HIT family protein [bacterium]|nr:HIT family protein [bacterium]
MDDCIFCKIVKKEIPADIIYEDDDFLAFLDINPVNPGHSLLIPKKHYQNLYYLPDNVLTGVASLIKKISIAAKQGMRADGVNIIMNAEAAAGQIVPHAHFHILPRFKNDGYKHWQGQSSSAEQMKEAAERIRENLER